MMRAPGDVDVFLAKAAEATAGGRAADARTLVRRALTLDPDHPGAQLRWAIEQVGQPQQARYHLRRAAQLGHGDPAIEYQVACVLLELGDVDGALMLARRAHRHIDEDFRYVPGLMNLAGRLADASGEEEAAERALGLAFALEPEMAWHGRTLAHFLHRQERDGEALRVVRAALRHTPDDSGLLALESRFSHARVA
jgi:tetratricopeptide (TPR) repeat protein